MAGGPVYPYSAYPSTAGRVFPRFSSNNEEGLGVEASLGADSTWRLFFQIPNSLPSGTAKLRLEAVALATTGSAKVNPAWASFAPEEDYPTPIAEGTQTLTWGAGDSAQKKQLEVILDADTVVADETIIMNLVFETASWTLAVASTWFAYIVWE